MRVHVSMIGSYQALVADVPACEVGDLIAEMGQVKCLHLKNVEIDGSAVAHSALVPVHRVQMIAIMEE